MQQRTMIDTSRTLRIVVLFLFFGSALFPGLACGTNDPWLDSLQGSVGMTVGDLVPRYDDLLRRGDTGEGDASTPENGETAQQPGLNPADIDPNDPAAAQHIRQWISVAEPPENAVAGNNLRYTNRGNKVGTAQGGVISSPHETGAFDPHFLWTNMRALDSINHCTMKEYVLAKLRGETPDHCRGRYGAVENLQGVSVGKAKSTLTGAGLSYRLAPGTPAKKPSEDGTIERQEPDPTHYLRKGATVTLYVHSPYVSEPVAIPDLVGKSRKEATKILADLGLEVQLRPGSPPSSPQESDTIEELNPPAGTRLEPGAKVTLIVRPRYVAVKTIPDVRGLPLGRAKNVLANAGIAGNALILRPGSPAPSTQLSGKVEFQEPAAGSAVGADTKVTLRIHSNFIDQLQVPDVVDLPSAEAKEKLSAAGFEVQLRPGPPAASQSKTGKVAEQQPNAGTMAKSGSRVTIKIFSPHVAQATPPRPARSEEPVTPSRPNLQCPASITYTQKWCLPDHVRRSAPPLGSKVPLDVQESRYSRSADGTMNFSCVYRIGNYKETAVSVTWLDAESHPFFPKYCQNDENGFQSVIFYSSESKVKAEAVTGRCLSADETMRAARELVRQGEPFALPCQATHSTSAPPAQTAEVRPSTSTTTPQRGAYAGTYRTNFGELTLFASGKGEYVRGGKVHIESTNAGGKVLNGFWVQPGSARKCTTSKFGSYYWGRLTFRFNDSFSGFKGQYTYCTENSWKDWNGTKASGS